MRSIIPPLGAGIFKRNINVVSVHLANDPVRDALDPRKERTRWARGYDDVMTHVREFDTNETTSKSLDLIGHGGVYLEIGDWNVGRDDSQQLADLGKSLAKRSFKAIRLLGCYTGHAPSYRAAIQVALRQASIRVYGVRTALDHSSFDSAGLRCDVATIGPMRAVTVPGRLAVADLKLTRYDWLRQDQLRHQLGRAWRVEVVPWGLFVQVLGMLYAGGERFLAGELLLHPDLVLVGSRTGQVGRRSVAFVAISSAHRVVYVKRDDGRTVVAEHSIESWRQVLRRVKSAAKAKGIEL